MFFSLIQWHSTGVFASHGMAGLGSVAKGVITFFFVSSSLFLYVLRGEEQSI